ncbi:autotransporter-associated beta strand repeat-containing protein [bacterium]|nr:autotransporter-associated beta strand repeat-containing protein [bacterium]
MKRTIAKGFSQSRPAAFRTRIRRVVEVLGLAAFFSAGVQAQTIYSDPSDLSLKMDRTDGTTVSANGPNEAANPVGKSGAADGFDRAAVFVFQLPDLGVVENPFGGATLGLYLFQDTATADVNGDLYGLGRRFTPDVLLDDYFGREAGPDTTDATLIQDDYLTAGGAPVNSLVTTSPSGSEALADYLNAQYEGGSGIGQYVFLRINTDADTTRRWNFRSVNGANGNLAETPQINYIMASDEVDTLQVETQADGGGTAVPSQTLIAGETLEVHAVARDSGGTFVDNLPVTWSLSNVTDGVVPGDLAVSGDSLSATFTASAPGTAEITIMGNASNLIGTGTITVVAGPPSLVQVETAPDGLGEVIGDEFLVLGESLMTFAVSRDAGGNFLGSVPAVWSLEEIEGGVVPADLVTEGDGSNATLTGSTVGSAKIRATVDGLTSIDSGVITVAELVSLWDGGGQFTNLGLAENWFADVAPFFDNTTDLIFNDASITRLNPYFGEDRTIRSLTYNADADKNLNLGLTTNGTTGAANLTFDTDSVVDPAEIVVEADSSGNFRLGRVTAPETNEYGSIILADDLLITHEGIGTLTLDGNITEDEEPRSIVKAGVGTVIMTGVNSYSGDTSVTGGVLSINGTSLSDTGSLFLEGGMVTVEGDETVGNLYIDGVRKAPGVYGSSLSSAPPENQDDVNFLGAGTVTVVGVSSGVLEILSITNDGTNVILTWSSEPGDTFSLFFSTDLQTFDEELDDGIPADPIGGVTVYTLPLSLLGNDVPTAFFRVVRN